MVRHAFRTVERKLHTASHRPDTTPSPFRGYAAGVLATAPGIKTMRATATSIVALGMAYGLFMVLLRGLLIEPVVMEALGPCADLARCTEVRCVFENQGPLPARGTVVVDTWLAADERSGRAFAGVRHVVPVSLGPGDRHDERLRAEGVPYAGPATMVRCMPGYIAGQYPLEGRP